MATAASREAATARRREGSDPAGRTVDRREATRDGIPSGEISVILLRLPAFLAANHRPSLSRKNRKKTQILSRPASSVGAPHLWARVATITRRRQAQMDPILDNLRATRS